MCVIIYSYIQIHIVSQISKSWGNPQCNLDSPRSWRWSGCVRVWGAWGGCRASGSSACTRDSAGRHGPLSAAACYCCTETTMKGRTSVVNLCLMIYFLNVMVARPWKKKHLIENAELLSGLRDGLLSPCLNTTSTSTTSTSACTAAVHRVFHYFFMSTETAI